MKLQNLYLCRSALEQGLRCSPNHWPCLENVITATFKLADFLACLGYCTVALGRTCSLTSRLRQSFSRVPKVNKKVYHSAKKRIIGYGRGYVHLFQMSDFLKLSS